MIETANPEIDVDGLMLRLRSRVEELRHNGHQELLPVNAIKLRSNVFINSLEAFANIADQKSQVRTQWPSHLGGPLFRVARVRKLFLDGLSFVFKDQRHRESSPRCRLSRIDQFEPAADRTGRSPAARSRGLEAVVRLAIVTPWFGNELRGGAERQSWQLAHHLAARGHSVDVLTTCSASFDDDWSRNRLRAGVEKVENFTVRRFKVAKRDRRAFARVNAILTALEPKDLQRSVSPIGDEDAAVFTEQNINSPALLQYLASHGRDYHSIVFIPYLYGTTLSGIAKVAERAYLQPCLHDEPYAYLPAVSAAVHRAKGLLFNSEGEYEIALSLFGPGIIPKSTVVGKASTNLRPIRTTPSGSGRSCRDRSTTCSTSGAKIRPRTSACGARFR